MEEVALCAGIPNTVMITKVEDGDIWLSISGKFVLRCTTHTSVRCYTMADAEADDAPSPRPARQHGDATDMQSSVMPGCTETPPCPARRR